MVQRFDLSHVACAIRIIAMAKEMASRGHQVTLIDFPHPQRRKSLPCLHCIEDLQGVETVALPRAGSAMAGNIRKVVQLARETDIIHLWKCYPDAALPALWAAYLCDKPVHYDWDDWEEGIAGELTQSGLVRLLTKFWEHQILPMVDTVSVASEWLKQRAIRCGIPMERLFDAPVGADIDDIHFSDPVFNGDEPHLVYLGQLEVAAYAEQAIVALQRVRAVYPKAKLTIIGGGRYLRSLKELAGQLGLSESVCFAGYRPAKEIPYALSQASVGLVPLEDAPVTRAKSPLKVVEYLAAGLPVVGSAVGEVPRMVGNAGLTVPPNDTEAFADAVLKVLESPDKFKDFSDASRARIRQVYNWSLTADSILNAYQLALKGK